MLQELINAKRFLSLAVSAAFLLPAQLVLADHLSHEKCEDYFQCVLGIESAVNRCNDNAYLKKIQQTKVMCIRIAQHECKKDTGILWTGKKMTKTRPLDKYGRPTLIEIEPSVDQDIEIYNYAGWNHCPPAYQGLQDFWCDPKQLRYPPQPWCDLLPVYNVNEETMLPAQ
ncbi:MAG: hypothetical protein ACPGSW_11405 [Phaeobacter italicus]